MKNLILLAITTLISGCAFSVHDLPVNYRYAGKSMVIGERDMPRIFVSKIEDKRAVENYRMLMHHKNGYGDTTTGGWQAEKKISLIVKDALEQGVRSAGLHLGKQEMVVISGEIIDMDSKVIMGWSRGTVTMSITVKLTARGTNEIIWQDIISGHGISNQHTTLKASLPEAFSSALDDLVVNLLTDDYFRQEVLGHY